MSVKLLNIREIEDVIKKAGADKVKTMPVALMGAGGVRGYLLYIVAGGKKFGLTTHHRGERVYKSSDTLINHCKEMGLNNVIFDISGKTEAKSRL